MTRTDLGFSDHLSWKLSKEVLKQHVCGSVSVRFDVLERFLMKFFTPDHPHPRFEKFQIRLKTDSPLPFSLSMELSLAPSEHFQHRIYTQHVPRGV